MDLATLVCAYIGCWPSWAIPLLVIAKSVSDSNSPYAALLTTIELGFLEMAVCTYSVSHSTTLAELETAATPWKNFTSSVKEQPSAPGNSPPSRSGSIYQLGQRHPLMTSSPMAVKYFVSHRSSLNIALNLRRWRRTWYTPRMAASDGFDGIKPQDGSISWSSLRESEKRTWSRDFAGASILSSTS
jgi:hypothetical protein